MRRPVHPRARGEHSYYASTSRAAGGTSPRTRGTRQSTLARSLVGAVHPRARGEHGRRSMRIADTRGTSPRTRGTQRLRPWPRCHVRYIPAHAGNTLASIHFAMIRSVHPRARGEHSENDRQIRESNGTSPRTRGTHPVAVFLDELDRYIPAHAGNTSPRPQCEHLGAVHPRARGEHITRLLITLPPGGTSPRTRGTLFDNFIASNRYRYIPAHAGNTRSCWSACSARAVHPRARGEHDSGTGWALDTSGTSPRTRGTPNHLANLRNHGRYIPAHAGNT